MTEDSNIFVEHKMICGFYFYLKPTQHSTAPYLAILCVVQAADSSNIPRST